MILCLTEHLILSNHVSIAATTLWSNFLPLTDPRHRKTPKSGQSWHLIFLIVLMGLFDRGTNHI